jgi:hypothetical protein
VFDVDELQDADQNDVFDLDEPQDDDDTDVFDVNEPQDDYDEPQEHHGLHHLALVCVFFLQHFILFLLLTGHNIIAFFSRFKRTAR